MKKYWTRLVRGAEKLSARRLRGAAKLLALSILLLSLMNPSLSYSQRPELAAPETTIEVTTSQLDSLVTHVSLLEADLYEERQLHVLDNSINARKLELYKAALKAQREPWYERLAKSPVLWVTVGMWVGLQASH